MNVNTTYFKSLYIIVLVFLVALLCKSFYKDYFISTLYLCNQPCKNLVSSKSDQLKHEKDLRIDEVQLQASQPNNLIADEVNLHVNQLNEQEQHLKNDSVNLELNPKHVSVTDKQDKVELHTKLLTSTISSKNFSKTEHICDAECQRFRHLLSNWTNNQKPKSAIHLLVQNKRIYKLFELLRMLDAYFNNKFHYPVILFYEDEFEMYKKQVREATKSDIYFQKVKFEVPDFLHKDWCVIGCNFYLIGYRHMCRFHAYTMYEEPILQGLDYFWRLDDDSTITKPINYDVFKVMRDNKYLYGYTIKNKDDIPWIAGLWTIVKEYANENHIKFKFDLPERHMFFNNFEISASSFWFSDEYQKYIKFMDRTGGIYYYRWGDSPIKSLAVSLFVPVDKLHHFSDIGYRHGDFYQN